MGGRRQNHAEITDTPTQKSEKKIQGGVRYFLSGVPRILRNQADRRQTTVERHHSSCDSVGAPFRSEEQAHIIAGDKDLAQTYKGPLLTDITDEGRRGSPPRKRARLSNMAAVEEGKGKGREEENSGSGDGSCNAAMVRLLLQTLYDLGYSSAAKALEEESKVSLESAVVGRLRAAILDGKWEELHSILPLLQIGDIPRLRVQYVVLRHRFLQYLSQGDKVAALKLLRDEMNSLRKDFQEAPNSVTHVAALSRSIGKLATLLVYTQEEVKELPLYRGDCRSNLLKQVRKYLPAELILPERRLQDLIQQAVVRQRSECRYHNTELEEYNLFEDHTCRKGRIPRTTVGILEGHGDEVWYVQFSHRGNRLASASRNGTVIIWDITESGGRVAHKMEGGRNSLSFICWSRDDRFILTCGSDSEIKLWDTELGIHVRSFTHHNLAVSSVAWLPDGKSFVSGGLDKSVFQVSTENKNNEVIREWKCGRVYDLAVTSDGRTLVAANCDRRIMVIDIATGEREDIQESDPITSLFLSHDDSHVLVNVSSPSDSSPEIHSWDLVDRKLLQRYAGHSQSRFVIRSCYGGASQNFVLGGSEDTNVYVWHRSTGELLEVLSGHGSAVNSVSWNPANPSLLASASDDKTVRLWGLVPDAETSELEYLDEQDEYL